MFSSGSEEIAASNKGSPQFLFSEVLLDDYNRPHFDGVPSVGKGKAVPRLRVIYAHHEAVYPRCDGTRHRKHGSEHVPVQEQIVLSEQSAVRPVQVHKHFDAFRILRHLPEERDRNGTPGGYTLRSHSHPHQCDA